MSLLKFNPQQPRAKDGKFASPKMARVIANAPDSVRFSSGPSLGGNVRAADPKDDRRSATRGETWQRLGNKIAAIPVSYTGNKERERPLGSYLHIQLVNQIPKQMAVEDHQHRVSRFIKVVKDGRQDIMDGAEKNRAGKKHVYLRSYEPASGGRDHWRMKPDLYPEGTPKSTLNRAYNHAALLAMHDRGLADYDFKMDDDLKAELKQAEPFIRYARARINEKAGIAMPGERQQYVDAFGSPFHQRKNGELTGKVRNRLRPNQQLIKASPFGALDDASFRIARGLTPKVARGASAAGRAAGAAFRGFATNKRVVAAAKAARTGIQRAPAAGARIALHTALAPAAIGSGAARGIARGLGAGRRVSRAAGYAGAIAGAAAVPASISQSIQSRKQKPPAPLFPSVVQSDDVQKMLAEAYDLAKRAPEIAAKLANSG